MTLKKGDRVKFINDVGGGIVTKIIDAASVLVETEDGFDIPVLISELLLAEPLPNDNDKFAPELKDLSAKELHAFVNKKRLDKSASEEDEKELFLENEDLQEESPAKVTIISPEDDNLDIRFALLRNANRPNPTFDIYLINDCNYRILYSVAVLKDGLSSLLRAGLLEDNTKVVLAAGLKELWEGSKLRFEFIFYRKFSFKPSAPLFTELPVDMTIWNNPVSYTENDYFDEKALIFRVAAQRMVLPDNLDENTLKKVIREKEAKPKQKVIIHKNKQASPAIEEVDLHIEELIENPAQLAPGEILEVQLSRFQIALEGAIRNKTHKIVFIHGIGNGKLKQEVRHILDTKYPDLTYQDASFKEYGFGATLVMIK
jgi:hypothetical protein